MAIPGLPGGFFSSTRETHPFAFKRHLCAEGKPPPSGSATGPLDTGRFFWLRGTGSAAAARS